MKHPVTEGPLPLFFSNPAVITEERHAKAGIRTFLPPAFARPTNTIPLTIHEFVEAAKCYPIVFTPQDPIIPAAVLGLEQENYFIGSRSDWMDGAYVPAYVRKYPFAFMEIPETGQLMLSVDESSPHFAEEVGEKGVKPLFAEGKPSEFTQDVLRFCAAYQEEMRATQQFVKILKQLDLLTLQETNATLPNGKQLRLSGFQIIDEAKYRRLQETDALKLFRDGNLTLIDYVRLSASNWKELLKLAADRDSSRG